MLLTADGEFVLKNAVLISAAVLLACTLPKVTDGSQALRTAVPEVSAKLRNLLAKLSEDKALLKRFGLFGPPGIIIFDKDGQEVRAARVIGYQAPERFLQSVKLVNE